MIALAVAEMEALLRWASWVLTLPVVLYSAAPFFQRAWRDVKLRRLGMDVPVALGIAVAFVGEDAQKETLDLGFVKVPGLGPVVEPGADGVGWLPSHRHGLLVGQAIGRTSRGDQDAEQVAALVHATALARCNRSSVVSAVPSVRAVDSITDVTRSIASSMSATFATVNVGPNVSSVTASESSGTSISTTGSM